MKRRIRLFLIFLLAGAVTEAAAPIPAKPVKNEVIRKMKSAADYQIAHPSHHSSANRDYPMGWVPASFYTGVMALYQISQDTTYLEQAFRWAEGNHWRPGPRLRHADDYCCGQTYVELAEIDPRRARLDALKSAYDSLLADPRPGREDWWWCDALFMSPPTLAKLAAFTGNKAYLRYLHRMFWDSAQFLFDRDAGLMYRDEQYFYMRTASGKKVFWARGNGWTMAGIVRILQVLPENDKKREWYINLLKTLSGSVIPLQGTDGLWRASLLDAEEYPSPESSSTGFICYALAWGVNNGILDKAQTEPAVLKAWSGLCSALHPDGKIGYVQPIGKSPAEVSCDDTQAYGAGAFLLAGSEVYKMISND